jgi:hypothetical protein
MKRGVFNMTQKAKDEARENRDLSKKQRSSYDEITNEDNDDHFLLHKQY